LKEEALRKVWWTLARKEEVLKHGHAEELYVQDYKWEKVSLDFQVEATELKKNRNVAQMLPR
jgi:hypothetical protein